MKAEYIITVDWDDSLEDDVDLWVKDPNGEIVSYLKKDAGWLHLDRDDRGVINDTVIIDNKYMYNKHEYTALILLANRLYKSDFYNLVKQLHEDTNQE